MRPGLAGARSAGLGALLPLVVVAAALAGACGKKGAPLAPFRRNPEPIQRLELAQRGDIYELAFVAPTRTVDGQQLPVLDVEILISSEVGALDDLAEPIRMKAAPGERLTHTGSLPEPGTPLRFAVRTLAAGKPSPLSPESLLVVKPAPQPPSDVSVRLTDEGLSLTWTECVPTTPEPVIAVVERSEDESPTEEAAGDAEGAGEPPGPPPESEGGPDADADADADTDRPASEPSESRERARPPGPGPATPPDPDGGLEAAEGASAAPPRPVGPAATDGSAAAPAPPAPEPAPSAGVRLYRRSGESGLLEPLVASALATEAYLDTDVEHGQELCYALRTVLTGQPPVEGEATDEFCATFLDQKPPPPPSGLSVLRVEEGVELSWSPLAEGAEIPVALRVYRAVGGGALELLAEIPGEATRWTDPAAPADDVVEYALTASDEHANESAPSDRARLIPR